MTVMHHDGYDALVEYEGDADLFHGEVLNLRDAITFQGRSIDDLKQAFADSIEDYLAFCRDRGEEPEKPFQASFWFGSTRPCTGIRQLPLVVPASA